MRIFYGIIALVVLAVVALTGVIVFGTSAFAGSSNDHVLKNDVGYEEYFKSEGDGKNYLYTITDIPAPDPGRCIVVSADSEKTIAVACNTNDR